MRAIFALLVILLFGGCGSTPRQADPADDSNLAYGTQRESPATPSRGGGYYKDDGPGANPPDMDKVMEPEPRLEPLHRFANNPYTVLGRSFTPMRSIVPFKQRGLASWYGRMFHGQKTSSGEVYDMYGMTAAHPTLPIPSYVKVTNLRNSRSVVVRVNDRGPFHAGRVIDLSFSAAAKLGYVDTGSVQVEVELIQPDDFPRYARRSQPGAVLAASEPRPATVLRPAPSGPPIVLISTAQAAETAADSGAVYLQLGSFSLRDNAEGLRLRVSRELAWLKEFVEVTQRDGGFRVQVGPYKNRSDAAAAADKIREAMQINPVFVGR